MIPITKPFLGDEEAEAARETILSGWVTQGPKVQAFEEAFAHYVGSRYACAVSSCTAALHLALLAAGVEPGDIVITVSHSFIATANAIRFCGAEPVFVDIAQDTYNIDLKNLKKVIAEDCIQRDGKFYFRDYKKLAVGESPLKHMLSQGDESFNLGQVKAIVPVHQMGIPCNISAITEFAREHGLAVVEDAACAIGSEIFQKKKKVWEKIGKPHGDAACFSFHPRKIITTGDGGMITTNKKDFDRQCRLLRHQGMSVPDTFRHSAKQIIFEEYITTAFNYRMTDIQAAVGIEQLKKLETILNKRRELAALYDKLLNDIAQIQKPVIEDTFLPNWQSYPIRILDAKSTSLKHIMQKLLDEGIATRRGIMNSHQERAYRDYRWLLPVSEISRDTVLLLPLFPDMTVQNVEYISIKLHEIFL
ncbi:DegT/DnrJ/EryC1/StrS family aminotransferase [candidate division CSSED10-310 bacterium]|uniref:DegT/DnrJ/EryC1/StrS family aminotransferase n=1 Tax=candidate division CSSED10-310 bacterium TaxID=2855610 RepID=A0ABV6YUW2_UNCC1